jgi:hypothetical protein
MPETETATATSEPDNPYELAATALIQAKAAGDEDTVQMILAGARQDQARARASQGSGSQEFASFFSEGFNSPASPTIIATRHLLRDPERFQWREEPGGVISYRDPPPDEAFDPSKCKPLSVWRDPKDEMDYVVVGHMRHAWAERDGVDELPAEWLQAKDADEARNIGRQLNMAEDAAGHEHKGKGPGGGQFVKQSGDSTSSNAEKPSDSPVSQPSAGLASKAKAFVTRKYEKLASRYGSKGAIAILSAMVLLSPVPVPGTSLIPIALAEGVRALGGMLGGKQMSQETDAAQSLEALAAEAGLGVEELKSLAQEVLREAEEEVSEE